MCVCVSLCVCACVCHCGPLPRVNGQVFVFKTKACDAGSWLNVLMHRWFMLECIDSWLIHGLMYSWLNVFMQSLILDWVYIESIKWKYPDSRLMYPSDSIFPPDYSWLSVFWFVIEWFHLIHHLIYLIHHWIYSCSHWIMIESTRIHHWMYCNPSLDEFI